jgi:hypothetical protein
MCRATTSLIELQEVSGVFDERAPVVTDEHIASRRTRRVEYPQRVVHQRADVVPDLGHDPALISAAWL